MRFYTYAVLNVYLLQYEYLVKVKKYASEIM